MVFSGVYYKCTVADRVHAYRGSYQPLKYSNITGDLFYVFKTKIRVTASAFRLLFRLEHHDRAIPI